ncbi:MAG: uracil-DNA glycosylase family protein [Flavobacteriales bacterium]|nr:uracil-DNA glycosylase family protein [Flavobacteriales bacterium]
MELSILKEIKECRICKDYLEPRPVVSFSSNSKILIIGQAPGLKVHESGIPWNDQSGKRLREWMGVDEHTFYDANVFGIVPMGFCYPGKGTSGDLPPRKECAPHWHERIVGLLKAPKYILIGQYAMNYYLGDKMKTNMTLTVENYKEYLPNAFVLPHPSPRNGFWLRKNLWFEDNVLLEFKKWIKASIK